MKGIKYIVYNCQSTDYKHFKPIIGFFSSPRHGTIGTLTYLFVPFPEFFPSDMVRHIALLCATFFIPWKKYQLNPRMKYPTEAQQWLDLREHIIGACQNVSLVAMLDAYLHPGDSLIPVSAGNKFRNPSTMPDSLHDQLHPGAQTHIMALNSSVRLMLTWFFNLNFVTFNNAITHLYEAVSFTAHIKMGFKA